MSDKKDKKVIEFPMDRVRPSEQATGEKRQVIFDLENKKLMVSASMVSFLFLMTIINSSVLSVNSEKQSQGRMIASTGSIAGLERNTSWERHLASSLSEGASRELASVGRKPTTVESFMIGHLQSHYLVSFQDGKINEVTLSRNGDQLVEPKFVNTKKFFTEYATLMPGGISSARQVYTKRTETGIEESFALLSSGEEVLAKALVNKDQQGRLISMKVQNLSKPQ